MSANAALIKRYNKLLTKLQTWTPTAEHDPLIEQQKSLLSQQSQLPNPASIASEADVSVVEEWLKRVEGFSRQSQIALGLGRADGDVPTPAEKKDKKEKNAAAKQQPANSSSSGSSKQPKEKVASHAEEKEQPKPSSAATVDTPLPQYIAHRLSVWDRVAAHSAAATAAAAQQAITITLPDGKVMEGVAGITTPFDIAKQLTNNTDRFIIAKIDDQPYDLYRPIEQSCRLVLCDFDSKEGSHTFWHSSAHLLGQAVEKEYKDVKLCIGPALEDGGFYYDVEMGDQKITPTEFIKIEKIVEKIVKEKQPFQRLTLTKEEALDMFQHNPFKVEIIQSKVPDGAVCTAYRCGPLVDLCKGPHVPHSGYIKAVSVTKSSSSYWLAKAENASLQRVYGISFPNKTKLKEWEEWQRNAEERDHRRVGVQQKLFFFHEWSPGSCFFLPHGTRIYNKLCNYIRNEYVQRGYSEVISPNIFNLELWKKSGHYENYKENMFIFECEHVEFGMKPMNCPGHCLMFGAQLHSYRDLPIRYADFGVLHRNEISGALTGLTRVRRFQQDDAHCFVREDQIQSEVMGVLNMLESVYGVFGFSYALALSTRPVKYLGEKEVWDRAEKALEQSLNEFVAQKNQADELKWRQATQPAAAAAGDQEEKKEGDGAAVVAAKPAKFKPMQWTLNPEDGAFYGPKIDIQLTDALGRRHQCATIQLDFQLPIRFELSYKGEDGTMQRPVIIHRAILGSVERMMAVLIEHTGGKWPFWLSPRQVAVIPVTEALFDYGKRVGSQLAAEGLYVDVDDSNNTLNKKIREAQLQQYNVLVIVGGKEEEAGTVTVRHRAQPDKQVQMGLEEFKEYCRTLVKEFK